MTPHGGCRSTSVPSAHCASFTSIALCRYKRATIGPRAPIDTRSVFTRKNRVVPQLPLAMGESLLHRPPRRRPGAGSGLRPHIMHALHIEIRHWGDIPKGDDPLKPLRIEQPRRCLGWDIAVPVQTTLAFRKRHPRLRPLALVGANGGEFAGPLAGHLDIDIGDKRAACA